MDQDDDIMSGTVTAPPPAEATSETSTPTPVPAAAAAASTADEHAASTSEPAPPAPAPTAESGAWGARSDAANGTAPQPPPAAPVQTEAQKREERRIKSLGADEKKRGKRMFGGLLGTLDAFKKEERKRDASEAAKRRTQIATRIQTKLRSETVVSSELSQKERELRAARVEVERLENEIRSKGDAYRTRHTTLRRLSGFLFTPIAAPVTPPGPASHSQSILDLPSPIPLGQAVPANGVPPLFFLPKDLTIEQDERLARQKLEVEELVTREAKEWVARRSELEDAVTAATDKIATHTNDAQELRAQKAALAPTPSAPAPKLAPSTSAPAGAAATDGWGEPVSAPTPVPAAKQENEVMQDEGAPADAWGTGVDGEEVEY